MLGKKHAQDKNESSQHSHKRKQGQENKFSQTYAQARDHKTEYGTCSQSSRVTSEQCNAKEQTGREGT